jgi:hypothetical protein
VHLDVENELLEAMTDTVSNRTRTQGEYTTVIILSYYVDYSSSISARMNDLVPVVLIGLFINVVDQIQNP